MLLQCFDLISSWSGSGFLELLQSLKSIEREYAEQTHAKNGMNKKKNRKSNKLFNSVVIRLFNEL